MRRKLVIGKDILLKLTALLLAILIWFVVGREGSPVHLGETQRTLLINTSIRDLGKDLVVRGVPPQVEVIVRGNTASLENLAFRVRAGISLRGLGEGRHRVDVVVSAPRGITVVGVSPRAVSCDIERRL